MVFAGLGATVAHAEPPAPSLASSVSPAAVLSAGNAAFVKGKEVHPHDDPQRRKALVEGQHPFVTVLSCSDSRVPPEIVFDQGLGDVFSVRVAGNVADGDELASVEYGVGHLNTPLLVVLGHTKCGAVTAAVTQAEVHGHLPELLAKIQPAVIAAKRKAPDLTGSDLVQAAIKENVFFAMSDLIRNSEAVRQGLQGGKLEVVGAVYDVSTGVVEWLGKHPEEADLMKTAAKDSKKAQGGHGERGGHGAPAHSGAATEPGHGHEKEKPSEQASGPTDFSIGFALVTFLCTLGGVLSARMQK